MLSSPIEAPRGRNFVGWNSARVDDVPDLQVPWVWLNNFHWKEKRLD